jgi:DHA2 family metal-tetracycline-proton antiporter-like MFS transporter/DHA2 family florfenicol/chloramphenicol resistance protein-like MFS transporter
VGLGLYQMLFFLGAGAGPALVGAFLAARRGSETALNPLYDLGAAPFSDAFLLLALCALAGLLAGALGRSPAGADEKPSDSP